MGMEGGKRGSAPVNDVVILAVRTMEVSLDRVPRVVEQENNRLQPQPHHRRQLLDGELNRTVADEEQRTAEVLVAGGEGGTERRTCRSQDTNVLSKGKDEEEVEVRTDSPPNTSPQDLTNIDRILRQRHIQHPKATRPRLTHNHILLPKELTHPRPHPRMTDRLLPQRILTREPRREMRYRQLRRRGGEPGESGDELGYELFHADGVVFGVLDEGVV